MFNAQNLMEQFKKAGLKLLVLIEPIQRQASNIFQMDIQHDKKGSLRSELFRMYVPHDKVIVQVRDTDEKAAQLLLLVKEPVVEFENSRYIGRRTPEQIEDIKKRLRGAFLRIEGTQLYYLEKTPAAVRYFLMGVDERQLFIAQLRGAATTVAEARKSLGSTVIFSDGARKNSLNRQGEWFFLEVNPDVRDRIDRAIKKNQAIVKKKTNIGDQFGRRGGNPHTVDEMVLVRRADINPESKEHRVSGVVVYVRGAVRHKDHKTIKFNHWREVVANNEGSATGQRTSTGIFWID